MEHYLKTWPEYWDRVNSMQKSFEIRKNDRDFQVNDYLILQAFDPTANDGDGAYIKGSEITMKVTYILHGPQFGIEAGYCVMQLQIPHED
jgi:hypothetical protein